MYLQAMQKQQQVIDHGATCVGAGIVGPRAGGKRPSAVICRRPSRADMDRISESELQSFERCNTDVLRKAPVMSRGLLVNNEE